MSCPPVSPQILQNKAQACSQRFRTVLTYYTLFYSRGNPRNRSRLRDPCRPVRRWLLGLHHQLPVARSGPVLRNLAAELRYYLLLENLLLATRRYVHVPKEV
jgi:hypothetical protein